MGGPARDSCAANQSLVKGAIFFAPTGTPGANASTALMVVAIKAERDTIASKHLIQKDRTSGMLVAPALDRLAYSSHEHQVRISMRLRRFPTLPRGGGVWSVNA